MAAKTHIILATVVFSSLSCFAWGAAHTPPKPSAEQVSLPEEKGTEHIVEIVKFKFDKKLLNVKVGDKVTWINKDIVPHTATALDKSWDSGRLNKGESFTLTIKDETSLDYFCAYHRQMKASLELIK